MLPSSWGPRQWRLISIPPRCSATHRFWHGDEHHSRGGYEAVYREDDACKLADAVAELALLSDMTLATLSAAGAVRQVGTLIDSLRGQRPIPVTGSPRAGVPDTPFCSDQHAS
ncbi:hypothetical protein PXK58_03470 [Phaeobacter gallaeciensis]|uniref:hypothetical protein n=1 Tax=Phaeobacter TaxID=302485 RepID=UPI002380333B|nr:hypothetical protein [Phaeobacter gallaeciensis]MDE4273356.1 hypothetical protein [Phaeobacter gallaeciensis]MDE4298596.1 hypothetical protein [Phaeobacter gallaeciensis]MDE5184193.1 hypothetical protein [Phaeobacter gallaeciensis]